MKPILKQIIDEALYDDQTILVEVPGYAAELRQAAEELGLKWVGTIPRILCHEKELHDFHFYITTAEEWFLENKV